jgi:deoxyribodipyrimidine photolyase-related protein
VNAPFHGEKSGKLIGVRSFIVVNAVVVQKRVARKNCKYMATKVGILFPHQLFDTHAILKNTDRIYLIEEFLFFRFFNFHKLKIAFHRASMQAFYKRLKENKIKVEYIESNDKRSDIREFLKWLAQEKIAELHYINPTDTWLEERIQKGTNELDIKTNVYENPLFLNDRSQLRKFFRPDKKSFFQTTFYKQQRKQRNILLNASKEPEGGKWSYDSENRKKFPKDKTPPAIHYPEGDEYWTSAVAYVNTHFADNLGTLTNESQFPYTPKQTSEWLEQFLSYRFYKFGDYEDAIVPNSLLLHHSGLTPMLNIGLISPQTVVEEVLLFASENDIPINSTEGFIRQIIGWREFMRGMYECKGSYARTKNFWGFSHKLPKNFYDGTTGILPVDQTVKKVLKHGYCHHIERLMILGNFMLLCEINPKEVYRWFMELFIDAYDWVMVPNVYGMSQFADGGTFATKPYISGSNYIRKMSNYEHGDWETIWDGLFWRFLDTHRSFFLENPRLGMLVRNFDKMDQETQKNHIHTANQFLKTIHT